MNHTLIPNITNYSEFCNTTVHTGKKGKKKKVYEEKDYIGISIGKADSSMTDFYQVTLDMFFAIF